MEGLHSEPLRVPRWCLTAMSSNLKLVGFCDASLKAYAAIVYVVSDGSCMFLASKTRVAPLKTQTIPRLELLGALLLARLITSVRDSLRDLVSEVVCYTDSLIVLYWIKGLDKQWKPFVQNRVWELRELVTCNYWNHCQGESNPADLPSRGLTLQELKESHLWLHGPSWLRHGGVLKTEDTGGAKSCVLQSVLMSFKQGTGTH